MTTITLDIETIPCQDSAARAEIEASVADELQSALASVKAPANYKDEAKIEAYIADAKAKLATEYESKVEQAWLKTGLDGGQGHICVIGMAVDDGEIYAPAADPSVAGSEAQLLDEFFTALRQFGGNSRLTFVGHHLIGFDLPFIWKRAMILGIKPPFNLPRDPKPWSDSVYDTMLQWAGARGFVSMDKLSKMLGLDGPAEGEILGAEVWKAVSEGKLDKVAEHCRHDVARNRAIYKRMTFQGALL